jgi:predicted RNA-binding Zn-ribbon protein involved in translation (DUF1610 family)
MSAGSRISLSGGEKEQTMASMVACAACGALLRVREEYVGRAMECPKCGQPVAPLALDSKPAEVATAKAPSPGIPAVLPARRRAPSIDEQDDLSASAAWGRFAPCPRCGSANAERVVWTAWGSFYGPALLHHVRCLSCGCKYNGRSGRSNLVPAAIFVLVPLILIVAIIGGLFAWLWYALHWPR